MSRKHGREGERGAGRSGTSARHSRNFRPDTVKTGDGRTEELRPELPPLMVGTSAQDRNFRPGRPELPPHRTSARSQPTLACCSDIDDVIAMEMRDSTICEMRDSTICEMSDSTICEMSDSTICEMSASTICELECIHFENMSDTPSEMRVVVDRSYEAISNSNNLPSTSSVFSYVSLGSMDDETPIMEKMYMVHEDDAITPCLLEDEHGGHMEPTTSTTPTSNESDYKGTYIGVDDAMIPLVDMMICECLHELDDHIAMSYASFTFPCDTCDTPIVDHAELVAYDDISMPCYESFELLPLACNMSNNCSFLCVACNDDVDARIMASPSINFNQFLEKEKLKSNGSNFTDWFRHVRIFLNGGNLQYVLEAPLGPPPPPAVSEDEKNVFENRVTRYSQVQCAILCSLEAELQKRFEHHDPCEMIRELKVIFETHAAVESYEASKQFFGCMMEEGSSVSEHVFAMSGHARKLSDLGIVIPNQLGIHRVLQSLPPSYNNFVMNYNMQNMNKELHELFSMLKSAEVEIQKEHQVLMVNKTTSFKKQGKPKKGNFKKGGKKAVAPPEKPKGGPKPDTECYYCNGKGHWKRNCPKYLADLKSGLVKKKKEIAAFTLNRAPSKSVETTPYELWFQKKPKLSFLKVWGCEAYVKKSKGKIFVAKNGTFLEKEFLTKEVTGRKVELDEVIEPSLVDQSSAVPEDVPVQPTPIREEANDNDHETSNEVATEPRRSTRERTTPDWYDPCLNVMIVDNNDEDPATYEEAMMSPDSNKWQEAMKSEMGSMYGNQVWTLVDLPDSRKAVENKWIFKRKTDADGNVTVYKARLVAKGFRQIQGVDYDETFSPIAKLKSRSTSVHKKHEGEKYGDYGEAEADP
ncbi:hypothetical protein QYE76_066517 [Lolium multiflorum]|uniref:CCHC-type domain-containing protein n=1 Tax=Lolium multiflorum TaxID=4521 RepID=A0AAD8SAS2_LOLMU|nr:hypothetical protein QYE76_066517 [Lolium multiflorum]